MGGTVAEKNDVTPSPESDDDGKAEKKEETADAVGGRFETVGSRVDSINTFGCVILRVDLNGTIGHEEENGRLTEKHVDEDFTQGVECTAEDCCGSTDSVVEGEADTRGHESGREDEDPAVNEESGEESLAERGCENGWVRLVGAEANSKLTTDTETRRSPCYAERKDGDT